MVLPKCPRRDVRGIKDIGSGRLFVVKPYGLARYDKQTGQDPLFPLTGGIDVKYGLTSNLVLNLTGNTDFADTDVDLEPFNLTPFKVFIPEKRQFFLRTRASLILISATRINCFLAGRLALIQSLASKYPSAAGPN